MVLRDQTAVESRSHGRVVLMMMMWKWISEVLRHEQDVYKRWGSVMVLYPASTSPRQLLSLLWWKNRDICTYLTQNRPSKSFQLSWSCEMARTLARMHDRHVLVADIASRSPVRGTGVCQSLPSIYLGTWDIQISRFYDQPLHSMYHGLRLLRCPFTTNEIRRQEALSGHYLCFQELALLR